MKRIMNIPVISRVEGHGSLVVEVNIKERRVGRVEFKVTEGARMFEAMFIGRRIEEVPTIASRICGICGPVHAICAAKAIEEAIGIENEIPDHINALREIIAGLNVIESHLLHVLVLSLPDFLGYNSILELPQEIKDKVFRVLKIRELVGKCLDLLCGERVHPKNIIPGGFTKLPSKMLLIDLVNKLEREYVRLKEFIEFLGNKMVKEFPRSTHYVALYADNDYPITYGDLMLDSLFKIPHYAFRKYFSEIVVPYSTSKKSLVYGTEGYMVGALARINTNMKFLVSEVKEIIKDLEIKIPSTNPYLIPLSQLLEALHLIMKIRNLAEEVRMEPHKVTYRVRHGIGSYIVEAPRGVLYHHYVIDSEGKILSADVVTPTAQNAADIENSIKMILLNELQRVVDVDKLKRMCEDIVRCYDPCISCSVHLTVI